MFTPHNLQSIFLVSETAEQAITRGSNFYRSKKKKKNRRQFESAETAYFVIRTGKHRKKIKMAKRATRCYGHKFSLLTW